MNKIYKTVWNASLACVQVVSELAIGHQSSGGVAGTVQLGLQRFAFFNLALLPIMVWAAVNPDALPQGGNITQGSGQIQQQGNVLNIQQNSQNLQAQWNSFNIGKDATVNFKQPNSSAVAVNQVLDNNASQIMGRLNANGQVFLLNPNGVIFSKTAQVNVGGLVASTLNLSESDALTGRFKLQGDAASNARVENHGSIIANGGTVALIAPNVVNTGSIKTANGVTHLTSANQVTLALQDGSLTQFQVDQGVMQGLVDNQGAIVADNGAVYLTAKGKDALSRAVVNHSGIIEANRLSHNAKGEVILLADMQTGQTNVSGRISAQGMNEQDGGFIETSAAVINIADSADITTLSAQGKTGEWLIDPFNVIISNGANAGSQNNSNTFNPSQNDSIINVGTLQTALDKNNVTVTTAGSGTQEGNITVADAVTWSKNTDLTLSAHNNIYINANITASHNNAGLNLEYGQANKAAGNQSDYYLAQGVKVNLQEGQNFTTKLGNDVTNPTVYTVITKLGSANSNQATDLQGINKDLAGKYVLGADIDASATATWNKSGQDYLGFKPLGGDISTEFTGRFDGLGHSITGLTVNRPNEFYAGLFGRTYGSDIRNVHLQGGDVKGLQNVGGLVGYNSGTISNSSATGNVSANSAAYAYVGGLVGYNQSGAISNSSATGNVSANTTGTYASVGGLVGLNHGTISNSSAEGNVNANATSADAYVGGLVGQNSGAISNSSATGNVSATSTSYYAYAGGLVGSNQSGAISNSSAKGNVSANSASSIASAGGLVGYNYSGAISNSSAEGNVSANATGASASAGGLVGWNYYGAISNSSAEGNTSANSTSSTAYAGGLVGYNYSEAISNSSAEGNVSANAPSTFTGGLVGRNEYSKLSDVFATGTVTGKDNVGGLVGLNQNSNIINANTAATSIVTASGNNVGGLIGNNYSTNSNTYSIKNSHALGEVNANSSNNVGGLIGRNENSNLGDVFAKGAVTGKDNVGGLVGLNLNGNITNANTAATSIVTASGNHVGGLIGNNYSTSSNTYSINNSHALGDVSSSSAGEVAVGGLIGRNQNSTLNIVSAAGNVSAHTIGGSVYSGGLVGHNWYGAISYSSATGDVNANSASAHAYSGGLVGFNNGTISNLSAEGNVSANSASGTAYAGGLVGYNYSGAISNSSTTGHVSANSADAYAGGLVGYRLLGAISNSSATGDVSANSAGASAFVRAGGLVGYNQGGLISNSSATGDVSANATSGTASAGGLVGDNQSGAISNSSATGDVSAKSTGVYAYVGGLIGKNANANVTDSNADGNVTVSIHQAAANTALLQGQVFAGGLIGEQYATQANVLSNVKANGDVSVTVHANSVSEDYQNTKMETLVYTGGLIGKNTNTNKLGLVKNAVSNGKVTAQLNAFSQSAPAYGTTMQTKASVGGLIGHNEGVILENIEVTGSVSANIDSEALDANTVQTDVYVGGLIGLNQNSAMTGIKAQGNISTTINSQVTSANAVHIQAYAGGLLGSNDHGVIQQAQAKGWVDLHADTKLQKVTNAAIKLEVGGGIGDNQNSDITGMIVSGSVQGVLQDASKNTALKNTLHAGGLIGVNQSSQISYANAIGSVSALQDINHLDGNFESETYAGGLIAQNELGPMDNVFSMGNVTANTVSQLQRASTTYYTVAGGLVGHNVNAVVTQAHATGQVNALQDVYYRNASVGGNIVQAGGLLGLNTDSDVTNAFTEGNVLAHLNHDGQSGNTQIKVHTGGLIATNKNSKLNQVHTLGKVGNQVDLIAPASLGMSGPTRFVGGLVGENQNSAISNAYAAGNISHSIDLDIRNLYITAADYIGGLIGNNKASEIQDSKASGHLDITNNLIVSSAGGKTDIYAGGLVGHNQDSNIQRSNAVGNVSLTQDNYQRNASFDSNFYLGGLIGHNENSDIHHSNSSGSVNVVSKIDLDDGSPSSKVYIGGLIGNNQNSNVVGSQAVGNVVSSGNYLNYQSIWEAYTGGLIGKNNQSNIDLAQATGHVSSTFKTTHQHGQMSVGLYTGGLIGNNQNSHISNVEAVSEVDVTTNIITNNANGYPNVYTGGLIGENSQGKISTATSKGNVSVLSTLTTNDSSYTIGLATGGLIGKNHNNSTINDVQALGNVDLDAQINSYKANSNLSVYLGGLIGDNSKSDVSQASATGAVEVNIKTGFGILPVDIDVNAHIGGLIGRNSGSTLRQSYATGNVLATVASNSDWIETNVGGLIGSQQGNSISQSHATGTVHLNATLNTLGANSNSELYISTGGLIGKSHQVELNNVHATGTVTSNAYSQSDNFSDIKNYKTNLFTHTGGLIGQSTESHVTHGYALGKVEASLNATVNAFANIQMSSGGLVGSLSNTEIKQSYAGGNVQHDHQVVGGATTRSSIGGLAGVNQNSSINIAYASGSVSGNDNVGGLIGNNENGHISNAYASGAVTGTSQVGGLVGNHTGTGSIAQTYAIGKVTGTGTDVGGLVGNAASTANVSSSFWDTQSTGVSTSAGGAGANGVSTAQIQNLDTFIKAGWDIDDEGGTGKVWRIYSGQTAPLLRSFLTQKTITAPSDETVTYNATQQSIAPLAGLDAHILLAGDSTGTNAGIYTTTYYSDQQGYDLMGDRDSTLTINKATLTVTANNDRKTYDATAYAGGNGVSYAGFVGGETAGVVNSSNVSYGGTSQGAVNTGDYVIDVSGLSADNYDITFHSGKLMVDKATLTLQADTDTRVYDGTTQSNKSVVVTGLVGTDQVSGLNQSFDGRNAGSRDLLVNGGYKVNDGNNGGNYTVVTHKASGNIAKATLDLQAASDNRTYNGTDVSNGTVNVSGLFGTDKVTGLSQSFDSRNAGVRDLLVNSGYQVNDGNNGGNYTVVTHKASGNIAKATLDLQAASDNRTYNGTDVSNGTVNVSGLFGTDKVTGLSQSFDSRNAGVRDLLVNGGYQVNDGNNGGNYTVMTHTASGNIAKATLDLQAASDNRTYNGTDVSNGTVNVSGLFGTDKVTGLSQSFDSRNAGVRDLLVNGGYQVNDGNNGGNYTVMTHTAKGNIAKATLDLQAASDSRTYNGTDVSNGAVTATGLFGTDQVTGLSQSFDSRNAGVRDLLVNSGYQVNDGNNGGNYTVVTHTAKGNIAKAALDLQAASDSRTYNATTASNGAVTATGLFGTDQVTGLSQSFDSRNAGVRDLLVNSGYQVNDDNNGGNYTVVTHTAKGNIAKATLDLQAASDSRTYNATTASNGAVTATGLFGTDQVTGLSQSFDSRNAGNRDLLVNGGYVVDDGNGGNNYDVVTHTASGSIAKAKLDAVTGVGALDRAYNGLLGVDLDYSQARIVGTLFGADQVSVAHTGTGTMVNKRAGANKQVTIQGLGLSGADAGNYELSDSTAQTQVDISKASIGSVSGLKGIDRQVDGSNSVAIDVSGAQLSQVVADDQVFVSGAQGSVANNQVGTHLVSITDIDLGGADADNYEWDFAPTTTTVNIVAVPTVPPTVSPTVAPSSAPQVAFSYANPYRRAIDLDEDHLKNPLNGNPVQIEIIGNGVNTDGIQTLSGELR